MSRRNDVFALEELNLLQRQGDWPTEAFTKPPYNINWNHGYVGGGYTPSVTTVVRLDFANDGNRLSTRGPLTQARFQHCGFSSKNYGYFSGGTLPGVYSSTERVDYSNDTASAAPKGLLSEARILMQGNATQTYAYISGGQPNGGANPYTSKIDRFDFSNDTSSASPTASLGPGGTPVSSGRAWHSTSSNQDYLWIAGGDFPGRRSTIERFDYSSDTTDASPRSNLSAVRYYQRGCGNKDYGYYGGAYPTSNNVEKLDYSNDTTNAVTVGSLATARYAAATLANARFGYWTGGGPGPVSSMDRVDFSNDTATAVTKDSAAFNKSYAQGVSAEKDALYTIGTKINVANNGVGITTAGATRQYNTSNPVFSYPYGYFAGGNPPALSSTERVDYSNDTLTASPRGILASARYQFGSFSSQNHGYFFGGRPGTAADVSRIDYANDTELAVATANLSLAIQTGGGVSNKDFGWTTGGLNSSARSTVQKIDFSNDATSSSPKGDLATAVYNTQPVGNQNYGYAAGGYPNPTTTVSRIDYSNDTASASARGPLDATHYAGGGTSNKNYGYVGGSGTYISTISRVDFSNDTSVPQVKGPLAFSKGFLATFGNQSFGYFGGGIPGPISSVCRIDYSNDTVTASDRGPLTSTNRNHRGASSQDFANPQPVPQINDLRGPLAVANTAQQYAYWGGAGGPSGAVSTKVDRIDYANDTNHSSNRGPLESAQYYRYATASQTHGYWCGGSTPSGVGGIISDVCRIDFANDTATGGRRLYLSTASDQTQPVANITFGYITGGRTPSLRSTIDRIDFANDTATASPKGNLASGVRASGSATGNQTSGWVGAGGNASVEISSVDRIDYSSDTVTSTTVGILTKARYYTASVGNANYGYWGGGNPGFYTTIDRVDYSNDTAAASPKSPFNTSIDQRSGASNANYGYWGGGRRSPVAIGSECERLDFSNDTMIPEMRTYLVSGFAGTGACSAAANGAPGQG